MGQQTGICNQVAFMRGSEGIGAAATEELREAVPVYCTLVGAMVGVTVSGELRDT